MTQTLRYAFTENPSLVPDTESPSTTPDLSITRATKATMVDADGYIREVQAGEARFTGATFNNNRFPYSSDLTNAEWSTASCSIAATGEETSPIASETNVFKVTNDGTLNNHYFQDSNDIYPNRTYIVSAYVKAGTSTNFAYIRVVDDATVSYNLNTGAVSYTNGNGLDSQGIDDVGDGWYRIWLKWDNSEVFGTDIQFYILESDIGGDETPSETSSAIMYVVGPMLEDVSGSAQAAPSSYIQTAASPASSLTGTSTKGLLVEEARTNVCLQSESLDNASWTKTRTSISANAVVAPDGSTTMDKIVDTTDNDSHFIAQAVGDMSAAGTASFFVKAGEYDEILVAFDGIPCSQWVDISGATPVFGTKSEITGTINSTGYEDFGGGIWRIWVNATKDAATSLIFFLGSGSETSTFAGTGSSGLYVWGVQVELASSFPTSYIPTTTTSVTRNAEKDIESSDVSWLNKTEGSTYAKFELNGSTTGVVFDIGIGADRILTPYAQSGNIDFISRTTVGTDGDINGSVVSLALNTTYEVAGGYANNDMAQYVNGTADGTETNATHPVSGTISVFHLGMTATNGAQLNGHIAEIRYYDERLDNTGLENLSNGLFPIPDVVGLTQSGAETLIEANGFTVGTAVEAYSDSVDVGSVISQDGAAGTYVAAGTAVVLTISLGPEPSDATGGWLNEYNAYQQRKRAQERHRKEILQKVRELDGIDGEIAELMQLDEAKADEDRRIAEFRSMLDKEISKAKLDKAGLLNKRINRAYDRAMKKATYSAIAALEREIEDAIEEEEFALLVLTIT